MKSKTAAPRPADRHDDRAPPPASDPDRLFRGLPLESGESQPDPRTRLH